ncbi:MAG: hypothetical protein KDA73_16730 [Rhodobacteraceae bacterium]|nr:hypothetical protein [Paracoccaceae bacterium]
MGEVERHRPHAAARPASRVEAVAVDGEFLCQPVDPADDDRAVRGRLGLAVDDLDIDLQGEDEAGRTA